jgi:MYXO-CTERM domain-containing protein
VQGRQRVRIGPAETTGEVWRLGAGDEYFLIENRGPGTFDKAFTVRGLAVYHVDRRVKLRGEEGRFQDRILDCVNCDKWHPYIMNVQGDGRFDLQTTAVNSGYPVYEDDLFRDGDSLVADKSGTPLGPTHEESSSNWYSGQPSGIAIRNIAVGTDGTIVAELEAPLSGQCDETLCAEGEGCAPVTCADPGESAVGCQCSSSPTVLLGALAALLLEQRLRRREQRLLRG